MKIAVTGLNNTDNPAPGVPVIRALRDRWPDSLHVVGLLYDALEPGAYLADVADANYMIPYPSAGLEQLFTRISSIHEVEKFDIIIPTLDSELNGFIKLAPRLAALGIKMFLPTEDQLRLRSKDKLVDFCSAHGIIVPRNALATSVQDLYTIAQEFEYPVAIKGIFYDAAIVNNLDEAIAAFRRMQAKWGLPVVVQEFIAGDEYNVCALGDGARTIGAVAMKKLYVTDKGKGWSGITINDPALLEIAQKTIAALQWRGGIELEFIRERETNSYYLLEINPRFPAWVYLAVGAGQNLPAALVDLITGAAVTPFEKYSVGKMFVRYSWDHITDIAQFESLTVHGALRHG
jgi:carbamoyl-phosphate synthase large subunit